MTHVLSFFSKSFDILIIYHTGIHILSCKVKSMFYKVIDHIVTDQVGFPIIFAIYFSVVEFFLTSSNLSA